MTYEYLCVSCGHEFETEQSIKDSQLIECPKCGLDKLTRQCNGGSGFILKGGGWEKDGYSDKKS